MLVLTRKLNEQIQIGNDITITVVRVKGNTVRVGIDAPRDVRIVRAELPEIKDGDSNTQAADRDGVPGQPGPVATPSAEAKEDDQLNNTPVTAPKGIRPLRDVMRGKNIKEKNTRSQAAKQTAKTSHTLPQSEAQHGDAASDDAIASLRLNPRRRVPGEKPAVLPRLPRLGPASPYTNRLAAYDQVAVLIE